MGDWIKRDAFILLNADTPEYHHAHQLQASFNVWRNDARSRQLVTEWLTACCDARILTDQPNQCGKENLPGFIDHRHDQAALSILARQQRIELFRSPHRAKIFFSICNPNNSDYPAIVKRSNRTLSKTNFWYQPLQLIKALFGWWLLRRSAKRPG